MKDPQRLEPDPDGWARSGMHSDAQGGYVTYEDYQALRKVSDDLLAALEDIIDSGEIPYCSSDPMVVKASTAIAAAKGEA